MKNKPVFLDYNATTPVHEEVIEVITGVLSEDAGNPASSHYYGIKAQEIIQTARKTIAGCLACSTEEVIFTSGATESNNLAILGTVFASRQQGGHIITSSIEHPSVEQVCRYLETKGFRISRIPVDEYGILKVDLLEKEINDKTILITVMHSNNETGSLQPVAEIAELALKYGVVFHTDAAQSFGKVPVNVEHPGISLLSLAGHKFYAPKGIGVLYRKQGTPLASIQYGASQEAGLRPGTENTAYIAGIGKAAELAISNLDANCEVLLKTRQMLHQTLLASLASKGFSPDFCRLNGHLQLRLPNTLNVSFKGINASLLSNCLEQQVAFSCGAACHSGDSSASAVLRAMNVPPDYEKGAVRLSTGIKTTLQEIEQAVEAIVNGLETMKKTPAFDNLPLRSSCSSNQANNKTICESQDFGKGGIDTMHINEEEIKLTQFTAGLGCACKLEPSVLEAIVKQLPVLVDPKILVGPETSDDAAVYKIDDDKAIVLTLDFFNPIVDDAAEFGAIAAANSLSDIYAMGATPLFALNIVGFPIDRLPAEVLSRILAGAIQKTNEAGIPILGGHTIKDVEPKYGLAVAGLVHPDKILTNSTAAVGDVIILTKPLGVGIISSALKKGMASPEQKDAAVETMAALNKYAAQVMKSFNVSCCTDVTGFGLLGHLSEVTVSSKVDVTLYADRIPLLEGLKELIEREVTPGGIFSNMDFHGKNIIWGEEIPEYVKYILFDAQTSGGLLLTLPAEEGAAFVSECSKQGLKNVRIIGKVTAQGNGKITVR